MLSEARASDLSSDIKMESHEKRDEIDVDSKEVNKTHISKMAPNEKVDDNRGDDETQKATAAIAEQTSQRERKRKFEDDAHPKQVLKPIQDKQATAHPSMSDPLADDDSSHPLRVPETVGELISVQRSEGKGYGVFALKDVAIGSQVLCEAPLVKLIDDGSRADPLDRAVEALSAARKKAYQSLHSYRRNKSESLNRSILYSNGFAIGAVATGVFEMASRINHSCVPNTDFSWDAAQGRMVYTNRFELFAGEEITIDYGHRKGHLKKYYGFECDCGGCTDWGSVTSSSEDGDAKEMLGMPNIDALVIADGPVDDVPVGEKAA